MTKSWIKIHLTFEFYYLGFRLFPKNLMDNTLISLQNWVIKDAGRLSFLFVERNCADIKRDIWVGCCTFLVLCELKNWGKYDCPLSWCTMGLMQCIFFVLVKILAPCILVWLIMFTKGWVFWKVVIDELGSCPTDTMTSKVRARFDVFFLRIKSHQYNFTKT